MSDFFSVKNPNSTFTPEIKDAKLKLDFFLFSELKLLFSSTLLRLVTFRLNPRCVFYFMIGHITVTFLLVPSCTSEVVSEYGPASFQCSMSYPYGRPLQ